MTTNSAENSLQDWLNGFILQFGGTSGTVHLRQPNSNLQLVASHNIPPQVLQVVQEIPLGKGMAGLAWQRDEPVSTCNIQTDRSGDVRPGARAVQAQAAVALPIHSARGSAVGAHGSAVGAHGSAGSAGEVTGVVGIAFADERTLTEQELTQMAAQAESVPRA